MKLDCVAIAGCKSVASMVSFEEFLSEFAKLENVFCRKRRRRARNVRVLRKPGHR
jgi:hypothetical protein